jgi:hypothetical protein
MKKMLFVVLFILSALPLRAEPVKLGAMTWDGSSVSMFFSTPRTTFGGAGNVWAFQPRWTEFFPTSPADLSVSLSGMDLVGAVTQDGTIYEVGSVDGPSLSTSYLANLFIPSEFMGGELTTPFLFEGLFGDTTLNGRGQVRTGLASTDAGTFALQYLSYEFEDLAQNPEPGTLLLIGTGAAFLARKYRRAA